MGHKLQVSILCSD